MTTLSYGKKRGIYFFSTDSVRLMLSSGPDKRIFTRFKRSPILFSRLHIGKNDLLTFYDGDDLTGNILGQYSGTRSRFKLYTSMADVTIQFQSDPATNIYGYNNGFVVHFFGESLPICSTGFLSPPLCKTD